MSRQLQIGIPLGIALLCLLFTFFDVSCSCQPAGWTHRETPSVHFGPGPDGGAR